MKLWYYSSAKIKRNKGFDERAVGTTAANRLGVRIDRVDRVDRIDRIEGRRPINREIAATASEKGRGGGGTVVLRFNNSFKVRRVSLLRGHANKGVILSLAILGHGVPLKEIRRHNQVAKEDARVKEGMDQGLTGGWESACRPRTSESRSRPGRIIG
jgi:hypothetical protein